MKFEVPDIYRNATGIYSLTNVVNGKRLIGQTVNFRARFGRYDGLLIKGNYKNNHLQSSYNKYGTDNFKMELVNLCDRKDLTETEDYYCRAFGTMDKNLGYNKKDPVTHCIMSDDSRKLRSKNMMGQQRSLGYRHTDNAKKRISDSLIDNKRCVGRNPWNKGMKGEYSDEYIEKLRKSHDGKKASDVTKQRMSAASTGRKHTDATKKKMSDSRKKLYVDRWALLEILEQEK